MSGQKALYIAYFTGATGNSIGIFYMGDGVLEGVDVGGIRYEGNYEVDRHSNALVGNVIFVVPANASLITGLTAGPQPVKVPVPFSLPHDFANGQTVRIDTPTGPVNAVFEKARDLK